MFIRRIRPSLCVLCIALTGVVNAQQQTAAPASETPKTTLPADEFEPAVDTSAAAPSTRPTTPASTQQSARPGPAVQSAEPPQSAKGAPTRGSRAIDRLDLETTEITGNRELPKVLYIVPWKRSDLGDLVGKPVNSLLDEVLEPVDRDVFRRENRYYRALQADSSETPAAAPPK